jgi:hypothetical protein
MLEGISLASTKKSVPLLDNKKNDSKNDSRSFAVDISMLVGCLKWTPTLELRTVMKKLKTISYTTYNLNSKPLSA